MYLKPSRAIYFRDLKIDSSVKIEGSHCTYPASFIQNKEVKGFYKELSVEKNFPELLAKMSVFASLICKIPFEKMAEERLVVDDQCKIIGIFSTIIKNFTPFIFAYEDLPADPARQEIVAPSLNTLKKSNLIAAAFVRAVIARDDDNHPHNNGIKEVKPKLKSKKDPFKSDSDPNELDVFDLKESLSTQVVTGFDFDMTFYYFTVYMKGPRPFIPLPEKTFYFSISDYENFPCLKNLKPFNYFTHTYPGQNSIPLDTLSIIRDPILGPLMSKGYKHPEQITALAEDSDAHAQKNIIALKYLLTFQPRFLRNLLEEHFGALPLNYTSLSPELRKTYEKEFPEWCNAETNDQPFVAFAMKLFQKHYDSIYRTVVLHQGTVSNAYGLKLLATSEVLYKNPSYFQGIRKWVSERNHSFEKHSITKHPNLFNKNELTRRYHQIWRDSHGPIIQNLIYALFELIQQQMRKNNIPLSKFGNMPQLMSSIDPRVTKAAQLFMIEKLSLVELERISVSSIHLLATFYNDILDLTQKYYNLLTDSLETENIVSVIDSRQLKNPDLQRHVHLLTEENNAQYVAGLELICSDKNKNAIIETIENEQDKNKFNEVFITLNQFASQISFRSHLNSNDLQMLNRSLIKNITYKYDDPVIINRFVNFLFNTVDRLTKEKFEFYISLAIQKYEPYIEAISYRTRKDSVTRFLEQHAEISNSSKLASILGSGTVNSALNLLLIKELIAPTLELHHLSEVAIARDNGVLEQNMEPFVRRAVHFAQDSVQFNHLYNTHSINALYKAIYTSVKTLSSSILNEIVEKAINKYEQGKSYLSIFAWGNTRKLEIINTFFLNRDNPARALALVFTNGSKTSSASKCLFWEIVFAIKKEESIVTPSVYELICQLDKDTHATYHADHYECQATRDVLKVTPIDSRNGVINRPVTVAVSAH